MNAIYIRQALHNLKSAWKYLRSESLHYYLLTFGFVVLVVYLTLRYQKIITGFLHEDGTGSFIFIALMAVLPVVGFPISVFLFLVGMQFGVAWGLGVTALIYALHLPLTYLLAHSLIRRKLEALLHTSRYKLPKFEGRRSLTAAFVFMAIPGLSYTLKNFILAVSGIPFRQYFILAWTVNTLLSIPFLGLGHSSIRLDMHRIILYSVLLLAAYGLLLGLKKVYRKTIEDVEEGNEGDT